MPPADLCVNVLPLGLSNVCQAYHCNKARKVTATASAINLLSVAELHQVCIHKHRTSNSILTIAAASSSAGYRQHGSSN